MHSFFIHLDNGGKVRRAVASLTENGRSHSDMMQTILLKVSNLEESSIKAEKRQKKLDELSVVKRVNLAPYFPISSLSVLFDFLSNKDGLFKERKEEFECYLNSCALTVPDMDTFSAHLLKILFTKSFIRDHRWPTTE